MDDTRSIAQRHSPEISPAAPDVLAASTASPRRRASGIAMMLAGAASNQTGAALGALAFPAIGPVGVVAVRQLVTALVLSLIVRPRLRGLRRHQWLPILGLALVFSVMNIALYAAIERIGLGLAVTLEFIGPLAVAIAGSRRVVDIGCAALAGLGVLLLTGAGPSTDVLGVALALIAAGAWAAYILLNRSVGQRLPGLQGTAAASAVTAGLWLPIGVAWFLIHPPTLQALLLAAACGILASTIPYAVDLLVLRRIPAALFGTLTSVNPLFAALIGWLVLHQALEAVEWAGVGLIVLGNVVVSIRGRSAARSRRPAGPSEHRGDRRRPDPQP
ncbi:EamA family transporter [Leucobacter celer]|uniref:EamA family transporter n=1 Tax=Leucobacter celer TaxID=668625 RepID=UPI000AC76A9F|nr:EamA family transporter [Leucobacter celer]